MRLLIAAALAWWWIFIPALAQEPASGTGNLARAGAAETKRGLLFELKTANNTLYLFGTIHVGRQDFYPLDSATMRALAASKFLAVEADISDQAAVVKAFTEFALYPPGTDLEKQLPPALLKKLLPVLQRADFPKSQAFRMKPWMLAATLAALEAKQSGYGSEWGVDAYLIGIANNRHIPIVEIEGLAMQFKLFEDSSAAQQQAFLEDSIDSIQSGEAKARITALAQAWFKADAGGLERQWRELQQSASAADKFVFDKLLMQRNVEMAARIDEFLKSGNSYFVAVGALHLIGNKSVVELLKQRGYPVRGR